VALQYIDPLYIVVVTVVGTIYSASIYSALRVHLKWLRSGEVLGIVD